MSSRKKQFRAGNRSARIRLLSVVVLSASIAVPALVEAAVIRLRATAETSGPFVQLADVADVSDAEQQRLQQLREARLAPAPAEGGTARLDFATIRGRLLALGFNLADVEFSGSSAVNVRAVEPAPDRPAAVAEPRRLFEITTLQQRQAEELVTAAVEGYLNRVAPELGRCDLAIGLDPHDALLLLSAAGGRIEAGGGRLPWTVPQRLSVRFEDDNGRVQQVPVDCRIEPYPYVVTVKHTVPADAVLRPEDLTLVQAATTTGRITRAEDVLGKVVTRGLRAGETLKLQDVKKVPLIKPGDVVRVVSRRAGITVQRRMHARNAGALGDTITCTSPDRRQKLLATVVGHRQAEVLGSDGPAADDGRIRFDDRPATNRIQQVTRDPAK